MSLLDRFRRPPNSPEPVMVRTEYFTNLANPGEFVNGFVEKKNTGRGCPLSSTPKKEVQNMTDNTQLQAMKDEVSDLKVQLVKKAVEVGSQIHKNEQIRKEQAFNKECEEMGLRFW